MNGFLAAIYARVRAFDSLFDSFEYWYRGNAEVSRVHRWIFWFRIENGRYPSNFEISSYHRGNK